MSYNSEAPLGRRLGLLRLPLGEKPNVAEFLGALRGARLEVHSAADTVTGRLLSVEKKTRTTKNDQTVETDEISLVTDAGEVRTVELGPVTSVRIADRDLSQEVSHYLGLLASTREKDLRRMTVATAGTAERQLYVSYISEVPIWKTTYRVVLPSKPGAKPLLQGWAIVDNTVGKIGAASSCRSWPARRSRSSSSFLSRITAGALWCHFLKAPSSRHRRTLPHWS